MINKEFHIEENEYSPSVSLQSNSKLIIKGESRHENPKEYYKELYIRLEKSFENNFIELHA